MFGLGADVLIYGWGAIENVEFEDCPKLITMDYDMVRTRFNFSSAWVTLNLKSVDGVWGAEGTSRNDFLAGSATTALHSQIVALNTEAFVRDSMVASSAQLFEFSEGHAILIGRSELYSLDVDAYASLVHFGTSGQEGVVTEATVIGHTIRGNPGITFSTGVLVSKARTGLSSFLADLTFSGFTATGSRALGLDSNHVAVGTPPIRNYGLFRISTHDATAGVAATVSVNETLTIDGRCLLIDGFGAADLVFSLTNFVGEPTLSQVDVTLSGLYDDEPAGNHYNLFGAFYITAAAASAAAPNDLSFFQTDSDESGGAGVDGSAFGALAPQLACNSPDCLAKCGESTVVSHTFSNLGIPAIVLGTRITGLQLGGAIRNFGAR